MKTLIPTPSRGAAQLALPTAPCPSQTGGDHRRCWYVCKQIYFVSTLRTRASSFSFDKLSISLCLYSFTNYFFYKQCFAVKLIFPLNWGNHGFGKLCPKGLDTLEIKYFCGALGSRCGEMVRDHVGQGYGKISQCLCTSVFAMQRLLAQGRPAKFACSNANCPHI